MLLNRGCIFLIKREVKLSNKANQSNSTRRPNKVKMVKNLKIDYSLADRNLGSR